MRFCDVSFGAAEILDMVVMPRAEIVKTLLDRLKYYKDQDGNVIPKESQSQSKSSSLSFISFGSDLFLLQILTNLKPLLIKLYGNLNLNTNTKAACDRINLLTIGKRQADAAYEIHGVASRIGEKDYINTTFSNIGGCSTIIGNF